MVELFLKDVVDVFDECEVVFVEGVFFCEMFVVKSYFFIVVDEVRVLELEFFF